MKIAIFSPGRCLGALLVAFLGCCLQVVAAPPANDSFANAATLPAALPVTVPTTNVEATAEAGEPLPESMLGTVWWTWTASATGWVKFSTAGTGTDTVLAVYTGALPGGLTLLMANDDGLFGGPPSDVILPVQAGQVYRIQVGGYEGSAGTFDLSLTAYDAPPQITALNMAPLTVDVTNQRVDVTGSISFSHPLGLFDAAIFVYRPNKTEKLLLDIYSGFNRISGTATESSYAVHLSFPRYLAPGTYPIEIVAGGANFEGETYYGGTTPFPPGLPSAITVVNTGIVDAQPPEVVSVMPSASSVDVTNSAKTVTFTFRVVDQLSALVHFASKVFLRAPNLSDYNDDQLDYHIQISGDYLDGTYRYTVTFPAGSVPGDYSLGFLLGDEVGNVGHYGLRPGETSFAPGVTPTVTVVNTGNVDTTPPVLTTTGVSPSTVNVAEDGSAVITVNVTDDLSGVTDVLTDSDFTTIVPVGGGAPIHLSGSDFTKIAGTDRNGTWRGTIYLPSSTPPGDYRLSGIFVFDGLLNGVAYGEGLPGFTPFPAGAPAPIIAVVSMPIPGPYHDWIAQYPALQGQAALRNADPDGDGYTNLVELALGLNPTLNSSPLGNDPAKGNAPVISRSGNNLRMEYTVASANLGAAPKTITVTPKQTTDFATWTNTSISVLGVDRYRASISLTNGPRRYMRLEVTDPAVITP